MSQKPCCPPDFKGQAVRAADVLAIGPLMIYGGYVVAKKDSPSLGWLLGILGVLTIWYNGRNYVLTEQQECRPFSAQGTLQ